MFGQNRGTAPLKYFCIQYYLILEGWVNIWAVYDGIFSNRFRDLMTFQII
jgi:hypothetical protein